MNLPYGTVAQERASHSLVSYTHLPPWKNIGNSPVQGEKHNCLAMQKSCTAIFIFGGKISREKRAHAHKLAPACAMQSTHTHTRVRPRRAGLYRARGWSLR